MQFFDTHCHLDFPAFDGGRTELLAVCAQQGLRHLLIPGVTANDWHRIARLLGRSGGVEIWGALGLHPCFTAEHQPADLSLLEGLLADRSQHILAIGEIGLDAWPGVGHWPEQLILFRAQLDLARQSHLPVLLHVRKAHDAVLAELRQRPGLSGIVHGFSGSRQQAEQYLQLGFKLGVGGTCSYPRAKKLRRTLAALSAEGLVLETDAPDMAPIWAERGANSPRYLPQILAVLAELKQEAPERLAAQLFANSCALFSWSSRA